MQKKGREREDGTVIVGMLQFRCSLFPFPFSILHWISLSLGIVLVSNAKLEKGGAELVIRDTCLVSLTILEP